MLIVFKDSYLQGEIRRDVIACFSEYVVQDDENLEWLSTSKLRRGIHFTVVSKVRSFLRLRCIGAVIVGEDDARVRFNDGTWGVDYVMARVKRSSDLLRDMSLFDGSKRRRFGNELRSLAMSHAQILDGSEVESVVQRSNERSCVKLKGIPDLPLSFNLNDGKWEGRDVCGDSRNYELHDGQRKLYTVLNGLLEWDDYLIYIGAAPGDNIERVLKSRKNKVNRGVLVDPRSICVMNKNVRVVKKAVNSLSEIGVTREQMRKEKSVLLFLDIRREHDDGIDVEEWEKKVSEDESIMYGMVEEIMEMRKAMKVKICMKLRIPLKRDLERLPDVGSLVVQCAARDIYELRWVYVGSGVTLRRGVGLNRALMVSTLEEFWKTGDEREQEKRWLHLCIERVDMFLDKDVGRRAALFCINNEMNKERSVEEVQGYLNKCEIATLWCDRSLMDYRDVVTEALNKNAFDLVDGCRYFSGLTVWKAIKGVSDTRGFDVRYLRSTVVLMRENIARLLGLLKLDIRVSESFGIQISAHEMYSRDTFDSTLTWRRLIVENEIHSGGGKAVTSGHMLYFIISGEVDIRNWLDMNALADRRWGDNTFAITEMDGSSTVMEIKGWGRSWHMKRDVEETIAMMETMKLCEAQRRRLDNAKNWMNGHG